MSSPEKKQSLEQEKTLPGEAEGRGLREFREGKGIAREEPFLKN